MRNIGFRLSGVIALIAAFASTDSFAASACDGLSRATSQSLYEAGALLDGVDQLPHQSQLTTCKQSSLFASREACLRPDLHGALNGRFGSCASFTGLTAATAAARLAGVPIPDSLAYRAENLVSVYDRYGNAWDSATPGIGSFTHILESVMNELADQPSVSASKRKKLRAFAGRYAYQGIEAAERGTMESPSVQALLGRLASHFNSLGTAKLLPVELVLDGWVLDRTAENYCAKRLPSGSCDETLGRDQRLAHSALIVGRRLRAGACEIQVRNSWKGGCKATGYGRTPRECDADKDSLWIAEGDLVAGMAAIRYPN